MPRDADIVAPHGRLVRRLLTLYGVAMYLFLFVPIVVLVLLSFNTSRTVGFPLKHLTLTWYRLLPDDVLIQDALSSSIRIGLWVTADLDGHRYGRGVPAREGQDAVPREWSAC